MTLLETLVAMAIVFIVFLGLTDAGLLVVEYNVNNTIRDEGVSVAASEMAAVRELPFSSIPIGVTTRPVVNRQIRGLSVAYSPKWTVTPVNGNASNLEVVIDVRWSRHGKAYNHKLTTIVRNG